MKTCTLTVPPTGVAVNDVDPDGNTLTAILVTAPTHGTLTLNPDGSFSYTPAADYSGPDGFTYKVSDGTVESNVATVAITVVAVNDVPVAVDDAYTTAEDTTLSVDAPGVLLNDSDAEGTELTAIGLNGPANGSLTINSDGSFFYTPNANYTGTDTFTYMVMDDATESNVATVTITITPVNDAPIAVNDAAATLEDAAVSGNVLTNDTDADAGTTLTATLGASSVNGTVTLTPDGGFTYTPNPNFNGTDSFTYTASDGTAVSNVATVTITVAAVNDAPIAVNDLATTAEETAVSGNVLTNDTDVDAGTTLTATLVANVTNGTVTLASSGAFTYTPNANFNGTDSVHLHGERRRGRLERGHRDDHGDRRQRRAGCGQRHGDDRGRDGGQRQRPDERYRRRYGHDAVGHPGLEHHERDADARPGRRLHLHAEHELQRDRQLHLHGRRRHGGLECRDGDDHGHRRQRRANRGQRRGGRPRKTRRSAATC